MTQVHIIGVGFAILAVCFGTTAEEPKTRINDPSALTWDLGESLPTYRPGIRLKADFDGDGIGDIAVEYPPGCGTGGYRFLLFVGRHDGTYRKHSSFFGFDVALERVPTVTGQQTRIWTRSHRGHGDGTLCQARITADGISEPKCVGVRFSEEADDETRMGDAIFAAVFSQSDPPILWEYRREIEDGVVWQSHDEWSALDSARKEKEEEAELRQRIPSLQKELDGASQE